MQTTSLKYDLSLAQQSRLGRPASLLSSAEVQSPQTSFGTLGSLRAVGAKMDVPPPLRLLRAQQGGDVVDGQNTKRRDTASAKAASTQSMISKAPWGVRTIKILKSQYRSFFDQPAYVTFCEVILNDGFRFSASLIFDRKLGDVVDQNCHSYSLYDALGWNEIEDPATQALLRRIWVNKPEQAEALMKRYSRAHSKAFIFDQAQLESFAASAELGKYFVMMYGYNKENRYVMAHSGILEVCTDGFNFVDAPGIRAAQSRSVQEVVDLYRYFDAGPDYNMSEVHYRKIELPTRQTKAE